MNGRTIIIGGIVASLVLAMWEMVVEALIPGGAGFFGPPVAIGATIVRDLQGSANPLPVEPLALVLGLAGHMMNSVVLAAIFGALVARSSLGTVGLVVGGIVWGGAIFLAMWYAILPAIDSLMLNLNGPAFLLGHVMWGAALGLLWAAVRPAREAGSLRAA
jgi:hypothetical protein